MREITQEAGQPTPDRPIPMTTDEVKFIAKMILDETMELLATVMSPAASKSTLKAMIDVSEDLPKEKYDQATEAERDIHKCADQADALVDACASIQACLRPDPANFVAVLCRSGRGRSPVLLSCVAAFLCVHGEAAGPTRETVFAQQTKRATANSLGTDGPLLGGHVSIAVNIGGRCNTVVEAKVVGGNRLNSRQEFVSSIAGMSWHQ